MDQTLLRAKIRELISSGVLPSAPPSSNAPAEGPRATGRACCWIIRDPNRARSARNRVLRSRTFGPGAWWSESMRPAPRSGSSSGDGKEDPMKIRELKRQVGKTSCHVWPPLWSSSYGADNRFATGDEGVLKGVQRWDDRLALTMLYDGREH